MITGFDWSHGLKPNQSSGLGGPTVLRAAPPFALAPGFSCPALATRSPSALVAADLPGTIEQKHQQMLYILIMKSDTVNL